MFIRKPSIRVGDEYLGNLEEEGIINWKIKLLIGKNEAFYLKYADFDDSGPSCAKDGRPTATRFDYLYPDEEIAGFAEEDGRNILQFREKSTFTCFMAMIKRKNPTIIRIRTAGIFMIKKGKYW